MNLANVEARLKDTFADRIRSDFDLARFTTYRLGGPASLYVEPRSVEEIERLAAALKDESAEGAPVLLLGRGSNLVISDAGWPGVVIRMSASFSWIKDDEAPGAGNARALTAGSATALPLLANWAARRGLSGLEFAVAIPGSVGGAVKMNAGAHGGEVADHLTSATIFSLETLTVEQRDRSALGFAYRKSNLGPEELVLEARFSLSPGDEVEIRERMERFRKHRADTQPGAVQNAGSVFKNPPGDSAGRLVEAAGLKGFRVGGAAVSDLHANFFIADRGATSQDVYDLVASVRARVKDTFGVALEPEIRFVGDFEERVAS
ncbi:MAG: UDP-N-acetylmuramate dehydrogenase [Actinomycetota bacterium]|jgi:UDP-N-acetylmuramate dehydrogenase|nr:UDP-N-acetylmuramate dehydrogenase [Actinomycetota bacterium]